MKRKSIGGGAYFSKEIDREGRPITRYWSRPWINQGRTWRLLDATTRKAAVKEAAGAEWDSATGSFAALAQLYVDAGCPNRRLETRPQDFCAPEERRIEDLIKYFGKMSATKIRLAHIPPYAKWRMRQDGPGTKQRAVDKDTQTLSNVMNYGVATGHLEINYVRSGRPRYRRAADVIHCRDKAPASATAIHQIADELFQSVHSEVLAWLLLFSMRTGCRNGELRRLRTDARNTNQPGYVEGDRLFIRRSKGGINPWILIDPEFNEMLECFHRWHRERFPRSNWYFPSHIANQPVGPGSLGHALTRICKALKLQRITPHGVRSFYVTKRRSDAASEVQIAGEIGDQTVALLQTTYGNRPESWAGGKSLTWLPEDGLPAWHLWKSIARKIVHLGKSGL